jgi:two-component sensor histidine kinase
LRKFRLFSKLRRASNPDKIAIPASTYEAPSSLILSNGRLSDGSVPASKPSDETERIRDLHQFYILDSAKDDRFDRLTTLTAQLLDVPIVLVSLVDESREWFKSTIGTAITEIKREHGFCAHAILVQGTTPMVVTDALSDTRFATHPFVVADPLLRFYAGAPLITVSGHKIGMLCVHDTKPRPDFGIKQQVILSQLAGIVMDEIDFHRIESERQLLVDELSHRVKNLIGVVRSVAKLSGRGNSNAQPFIEAFSARLAAMSTAHEKLVTGDWQGADLGDLVAGVVAAHQNLDQSAIFVQIPPIQVDASFSQTFALLVHELLTNAIKYGALSIATGQVSFTAKKTNDDGNPFIAFEWRETGGPIPELPKQVGFGHRLIEEAVRQKNGTLNMSWPTEGLICRFTFADQNSAAQI